jgi:hypothetical protein
MDKEDTQKLAILDPSLKSFRSGWTFPVTVGLNVRI